MTLPCECDSLIGTSGLDIYITYKDNYRGVLDGKGKVVLPCEYTYVLSSRFAIYETAGNIVPAAKAYGKWMIFNRDGLRIDDKIYKRINLVDYPDIVVYESDIKAKSSKWLNCCGALNTKGEVVVQPQYLSVGNFSYEEGLAWAKKDNGAYVCINTKGQELFGLPEGGETPGTFESGMSSVTNKDGLIGYCDAAGRLLIPYKCKVYQSDRGVRHKEFNGNKAYVSLDGVNGRIDRQGIFTPEKKETYK